MTIVFLTGGVIGIVMGVFIGYMISSMINVALGKEWENEKDD